MTGTTHTHAGMTEVTAGDAVQIVRSAEQVALHLPIAGPGSRILAYAIDALVVGLIEVAIFMLLMLTTSVLQPLIEAIDVKMPAFMPVAFAVLVLVSVFVEWIYFIASELISNGRSIGKAAVGLRVVGVDGFPLTVRASLVRNLLRLVDVLPGSYVVGLVALLVTSRGQRLGDLAAGTLVVRLDRPAPALEVVVDGPSTGPYRFSRAQLARLGTSEKMLLRETLRRLDTLDPEQAAHALRRAADVLHSRLGEAAPEPPDDAGFLRALLAALERR